HTSTLSLHDALPISCGNSANGLNGKSTWTSRMRRLTHKTRNYCQRREVALLVPSARATIHSSSRKSGTNPFAPTAPVTAQKSKRSEEHTSELQSRSE